MKPQQDSDKQNTLPPPVQLFEIATGFIKSQAIYVAAKLGIADLLTGGAKNVEELARATKVDSKSLYRLLRALASIGIFAERDNGDFELTPMASALLLMCQCLCGLTSCCSGINRGGIPGAICCIR